MREQRPSNEIFNKLQRKSGFSDYLKKKNKSDKRLFEDKLPEIKSFLHHNTIQATNNLKRHKRSISSYDVSDFQPRQLKQKQRLAKYLSSKVDFFNNENQRRLQMSKNKIMVDMGIKREVKQKEEIGSKIGKPDTAMTSLLKKYLNKRSQSEIRDNEYFVLGKDSTQYD